MHFVRRAAARAASSPATSFISQSRAINTSSPSFLLRSKIQSTAIVPSAFRRYNDDAAPPSENRSYGGGERGGERGYGGRSVGGRDSNRGFGGRDGGRGFTPREPRERPEPVPTDTVYVGNLLFEVTAADLEKEFAQFGSIVSATVATDARQLSKGFAYVQFESIEQAKAAIEGKNQEQFEGRRMIVNYMNKSTRTEGATNPPSKTLFVGNLAFEMSDKDLNNLFRDIRNVVDVRVAIDRRTGQPRGFAHADFVDTESATIGLEALQGKEVYGRKLRLDYSAGARENRAAREERPSESGESSEGSF